MKPPSNVTELCRFLSMINQLSKFYPHLANKTQSQYAQIEKEVLTTTWACEHFQEYLPGKHFKLETDHKLLVPLLSSKSIDEMSIRMQRFRLCLMRFSYEIYYVPGTQIYMAETLSRAPITEPDQVDEKLQKGVNTFVDIVIENLPVTTGKLKEIKSLQDEDPICQQLKKFCQDRWPSLKNSKVLLNNTYPVRVS